MDPTLLSLLETIPQKPRVETGKEFLDHGDGKIADSAFMRTPSTSDSKLMPRVERYLANSCMRKRRKAPESCCRTKSSFVVRFYSLLRQGSGFARPDVFPGPATPALVLAQLLDDPMHATKGVGQLKAHHFAT